MRTPAAVPLLLLASGLLLAGCAGSGPTTITDTPDHLAYGDVDLRRFHEVGYPVTTVDDAELQVLAAEADTLLWFRQAETRDFRLALLRRGQSVYVLGITGHYLHATPTQSVMYALFMDDWRAAQRRSAIRSTPKALR